MWHTDMRDRVRVSFDESPSRREVILLLERLPRSVLVICPGDDVQLDVTPSRKSHSCQVDGAIVCTVWFCRANRLFVPLLTVFGER